MPKEVHPGDVVLVTRLDRLARSTRDLLNVLGALADKGAAFRSLGSRLIEFHSQNKTVAASMIAEKKVSGQRSYRVATRRQSFRRPNMISMRLRRL